MSTRHERRRLAKAKSTLSRHATDDEILPGGHRPLEPTVGDAMIAILEAVKATFPDHEITLFIAERTGKDGQLPRFNYASTAAREDMYAVLRAFLNKNSAIADKLDKIMDEPTTETRQ